MRGSRQRVSSDCAVGRSQGPAGWSRLILICLTVLIRPATAQVALVAGVPVPFSYPATPARLLVNGTSGFRIAAPADTLKLEVKLETATPEVDVDLYARCGMDVAISGSQLTADASSQAKGTGNESLSISYPMNGQAGTCFIALDIEPTTMAIGGRLTAVVHSFPAGNRLQVPATAQLYLAGQPDGVVYDQDSVPLYSPPQSAIALTAGQGIQIRAAGQIDCRNPQYGTVEKTSPAGIMSATDGLSGAYGLSSINGPACALVGVFVGPSVDSRIDAPELDFRGGLSDIQTLRPLLQQVFLVGDGFNTRGEPRVFVVPPGATRLFFGVLNFRLAVQRGAFTVSTTVAAIPSEAASNPLSVPALAQLYLAGQPNGTVYDLDSAPVHSPAQAGVPITAGQGFRIRATGQIECRNPIFGSLQPAGPGGIPAAVSSLGAAYGLSGIRSDSCALIGVFTGPSIDSRSAPPDLDFTGGLVDVQALRPLLQQVFYIGDGLTPAGQPRVFTAPTGATRLFLGVMNFRMGLQRGAFTASVAPADPGAPQVSSAGITNAAGFGPAPLAAGSVASLYGSNFGELTAAVAAPLPTTLSGTRVYFNTYAAPLFFVSPGQINAQVPVELRGETTALVTVVRNGVAGPAATVELAPYAPGIFTAPGVGPVIVNTRTGALVTDSSRAKPGDILVIYATGIGPVLHDPPTGSTSSLTQLSPALLPMEIVLQGQDREVAAVPLFAGLAPGLIGVSQINFAVPADSPTGRIRLRLQSVPLAGSNTVELPLE